MRRCAVRCACDVPFPRRLTLALAPAQLERLIAAPPDGVSRPQAAQRRRTVYWDTAGLALWRAGLGLAVEHDGAGWTQALEPLAPASGAAAPAAEDRVPLPGPTPDAARLGEPAARARLRGAALQPVFAVEFERRGARWALAPDSEAELCFDRGAIRAGRRRARLCEIELHAREGAAWRLYEAALALESRAALRPEPRSRAARGYALAFGVGAGPAKADLDVVREPMRADEAFREICLACLAHLEANRPGMLAGRDPEYLHQMRVALRRLRSAFSVFGRLLPRAATEGPIAEMRRLAAALGPARDWDVVIASVIEPLAAQLPGHRGLIALARALDARRERARRAAQRAVRSRAYARFVLGFAAWLGAQPWGSLVTLEEARKLRQPVRRYAERALARRYRQVRRRGRGLARLDAAALHRLRIAVKKLRYAAQFFAPLYSARRAAPMRAALEALQEALGGINDCAQAEALVREARARRSSDLRAQAEALALRWIETARREHRRHLEAAWKAFRAAPRYWED